MKRIAICADGTWNEPTEPGGGTNVSKLAQAVLPEDAKAITQVVFYHKGVGERGGLWDHISGGAFGVGISANIEDLYIFLVSNYQPGDQLFFFGFSRGAYTVRSLAGLIRNCGILKRDKLEKYKQAYDIYRDQTDGDKNPNGRIAREFRRQNTWSEEPIPLHFIGVWDTVGALGVPVKPLRFWTKRQFEFHDVKLSGSVKHAYQALAVDERRKPFAPSVWEQGTGAGTAQVLEQAWFPGVHCDVGGGYAATGLSDRALVWMWARAEGAGLALDSAQKPKPNPAATPGLHDSMTLGYRLLGSYEREPGKTGASGKEGVAPSTVDRTEASAGYKPPKLMAFLSQNPPVYE